jgi:hypothetical protein
MVLFGGLSKAGGTALVRLDRAEDKLEVKMEANVSKREAALSSD